MDYLLMVPAVLVVAAVVMFCLPLASRKQKRKPQAEKEQMRHPQEEFIADDASNGRTPKNSR